MSYHHQDYPTPNSSLENVRSRSNSKQVQQVMDDITRGTGGESARPRSRDNRLDPDRDAKILSKYYEDAFAIRDTEQSPRDMVVQDAPVVAELKTNVILRDEFTFITSLSNHIAKQYEKSESCITIILNHSSCLMLGGSFDPACLLVITTVASSITPAVNRRFVSLTSQWLAENLQVESPRAIIKFEPVADSDLGVGGNTIAGEVDVKNGKKGYENGGIKRRLSTISRRQSWFRPPSRAGSVADQRPASRGTQRNGSAVIPPAMPPLPKSTLQSRMPNNGPEKEDFAQQARRRRSLVGLLRKGR